MMIDLSHTRSHKVFLVEAQDDTLIVTPTGEAIEFRHSLVVSEVNTILELLDNPEIRHLVIDLNREEYFGSALIGTLNTMIDNVADRGGRTATCHASEEMQNVIQIMNLSERWPNYPSRRKALKAMKA